MRDDVAGIVLAGGEGKRMGQPKAFVPFLGEPLLSRAARTMRDVAAKVVVATGPLRDARPWQDAAGEDARLVPDMGGGPMAGLRAGAAATNREWLLVMPVDMPLVTRDLLEILLLAADGHDGAIAVDDAREQPLLACYHGQRLMRAAATVHLPRELPSALHLARVDAAAIAGVPYGADALRDADTPEALAELEKIAGAARA